MRRAFCVGLFTLCFGLAAAAAQAATANFQGNCSYNSSGTTLNCTFSALRPFSNPSSCPNNGLPTYFWDFGDDNDPNASGNTAVTSHSYTSVHGPEYYVSLSVFCPDGSSATATRPVCISFGYMGCIFNNGTWS